MNKIKVLFKKFGKSTVKAVMMSVTALSLVVTSMFGASAADVTATDAVSGVTSVFSQITSTINIESILSILGIVIGACVGLVLLWWGLRKVIRIIMSAFKKGKISV